MSERETKNKYNNKRERDEERERTEEREKRLTNTQSVRWIYKKREREKKEIEIDWQLERQTIGRLTNR